MINKHIHFLMIFMSFIVILLVDLVDFSLRLSLTRVLFCKLEIKMDYDCIHYHIQGLQQISFALKDI